jgi:Ca2+-transporting ATPase
MTGTSAFSGIHKERTFILISLLILVGQVLIVTFGGKMFSVEPLAVEDWVTIFIITSPVLLINELVIVIKKLFNFKSDKSE